MSRKHQLLCIIADALTILAGITLFSTVMICSNQVTYLRDFWRQIYAVSIYSLVVGLLTALIAATLLYVVVRRFQALTTLLSVCLIVVAFLAAIGAVILLVGQTTLHQTSFNHTDSLFRNYSDSDLAVSSKATFARIQQDFQCCGVLKATDWQQKIADNTSVPDSCCVFVTLACGKGSLLVQGRIYLRGCAELIYDRMNRSYRLLIGMLITVVILSAIGAVTGLMFQRLLQENYQAM